MDGTEEVQVIELAGRRFRVITGSTVEHDHWYMRHVRAAGLDSVAMLEGETAEAFAYRVMGAVIDSGRVSVLLAGLLVPADAPGGQWSPAIAAATAEFISQLTDPESKNRVHGLTAGLVADFFAAGLTSSAASPLSSAGQPVVRIPTRRGASGRGSSGGSRASTLAARLKSFAGRSWRRFTRAGSSSASGHSRSTATAASSGR